MTFFSVIIPNYNHADFLRKRFDSVLQQTYRNFEIIILDDCSNDNSRQIIEEYRKCTEVSHIIYNEENSGSPFRQWEIGARLAKGDWVWIAESDDFSSPSFLEEAEKVINQFSSVGLFYCDSFVINEINEKAIEKFSEYRNKVFGTTKWGQSYLSKGVDEINECLKFDCTVNNISSAVFKKSILIETSKDLSGFRYYGDWFFVLKAGFSSDIYYCNNPLNYYRRHGGSHLNKETSIIISRSEYFRILQLLYYSKDVTEKKKVLNHFAYHYLGFGLKKDGLKKGLKIVKSYFKMDKLLALKIIRKMPGIKLGRKRSFFARNNVFI